LEGQDLGAIFGKKEEKFQYSAVFRLIYLAPHKNLWVNILGSGPNPYLPFD
jgi:hypothetical protein